MEEMMKSSLIAEPGFLKNQKPVLTTSAPGKTPVSYSPLEGYCKNQNTVRVFSCNIFILPKFMAFENEFSEPVIGQFGNVTALVNGLEADC
jgi:hypothetical protein